MFNFWPFNIPAKRRAAEQARRDEADRMAKEAWQEKQREKQRKDLQEQLRRSVFFVTDTPPVNHLTPEQRTKLDASAAGKRPHYDRAGAENFNAASRPNPRHPMNAARAAEQRRIVDDGSRAADDWSMNIANPASPIYAAMHASSSNHHSVDDCSSSSSSSSSWSSSRDSSSCSSDSSSSYSSSSDY